MYARTTGRPKCATIFASSSAPLAQAATCARRSARFWSTLRDGYLPDREDRAHLRLEEPPLGDELHVVEQHALLVDVRRIGRHRARRDAADVGVVAARRDIELRLGAGHRRENTGAITVTSGRCVPPLYGAFSTNTSPRRIVPRRRSMIVLTLSPIEPRCTGMCGALAIRLPSASNSAHEKSSRSLMLTEYAVLASVTPICSAIAMNRLLKTSSSTGSAVVPIACARRAASTRSSTRSPRCREGRAPARLDDGRRVVLADHRGAGDGVARAAGARDRRRRRRGRRPRCRPGSSGSAPAAARAARAPGRHRFAACVRPIASTATASTTSGLPGIRKPYCWRYLRSNSPTTHRGAARRPSRASCRCPRT